MTGSERSSVDRGCISPGDSIFPPSWAIYFNSFLERVSPMRKNIQDSLPNDQKTAPRQRSDYSESGVDRTLIHWMLSLTPMERLLAVQEQVNAIQAMRAQLDPH